MTHLRRGVRSTLAVLAALVALPATASAAGLTVTTSPVDTTLLTDTYALIGGIVNPGGSATSYQFEWGPTTAYGQTTALTSAGAGTSDVPVDFSLDNLKPLSKYHFRLVAIPTGGDASRRVVGADQAFKTTRALALSVLGRTAKVGKDHKAGFSLKVVGPPDTAAQGIVTVKAVIGKLVQTITLVPYTIGTGRTKKFAVRLPAAVRTVLAATGHPKVVLRVLAKTSGIKKPVVKNLKVVG